VSTYSYTQISQYLSCPRRYKYRYVDGWQEKETRAGMLFGRAFEAAVGALFRGEDCGQVLFHHWSAYRNLPLDYSCGDTWIRCSTKAFACLKDILQPHAQGAPEVRTFNVNASTIQSIVAAKAA
jgi:hypothetical protein